MILSFGLLSIFGLFFVHFQTVYSESHICGVNENSFVCCSGYRLDSDGDCTIPICVNRCGRNGACVRPNTCQCSNGMIASSCDEEDQNNNGSPNNNDNECRNNCNNAGTCVNGRCQCKPEFTGESCSEIVNGECFLNLSRGICMKHPYGFQLSKELCCGAFQVAWGDPCQRCELGRCEKGFIEIDGICRDINECQWPQICKSGKCINERGSFRCLCSSSYQFDPIQADCVQMKKKCEQIPNLCGPGMDCVSLSIYNHLCKCLPGYVKSLDGKSCSKPSATKYNMCRFYGPYVCHFGKCIADGYNYKCECNQGYIASSDGKSCKKTVDFCTRYSGVVCPNGKCVSLSNDYICQCDPGYTSSYDRKKCTSICDLYPRSLCPDGQCIPQSNNGYECRCLPGFALMGKGKQCRRIMSDQSEISPLSSNEDSKSSQGDIDFCSYSYYRDQCNGGACINMKNHYRCECLQGFVLEKQGQACKEKVAYKTNQMNDVASSFNLKTQCDKFGSFLCNNGRCIESGSSYQCQCNTGYQVSLDGKQCSDIDECSMNPSICDQGTCINSPGSYQCSCFDGFTIHNMPGGPKCYDRNECTETTSLCKNGICRNTHGSFECQCNSGYISSNKKQDCVSVQDNSDQRYDTESTKICKKCSHYCKFSNGVFKCSCPNGLDAVLETGLCAKVSQIVDVQFDIPDNVRVKRNTHPSLNNVYFEVVSATDIEDFRSNVTTQFNDIVLDKCESWTEHKPNSGVRCFYHKIS